LERFRNSRVSSSSSRSRALFAANSGSQSRVLRVFEISIASSRARPPRVVFPPSSAEGESPYSPRISNFPILPYLRARLLSPVSHFLLRWPEQHVQHFPFEVLPEVSDFNSGEARNPSVALFVPSIERGFPPPYIFYPPILCFVVLENGSYLREVWALFPLLSPPDRRTFTFRWFFLCPWFVF